MSAANASVARRRGANSSMGPSPSASVLAANLASTPNVRRHIVVKHAGIHFLERHRLFIVLNSLGITAEPLKPGDCVLGIGHAAAEHEQLGLRRRHRDGQFVVQATAGIAEHLVFVDDQQLGTVTIDQSVFLGLKRGNDDRCVKVFGEVTGGDADVPATGTPLESLSLAKARVGTVDRLAWVTALVGPQFEDERFARPGRCMYHHILSIAKMLHGLLLPKIRHDNLIQGGKLLQRLSKRRHRGTLPKSARTAKSTLSHALGHLLLSSCPVLSSERAIHCVL